MKDTKKERELTLLADLYSQVKGSPKLQKEIMQRFEKIIKVLRDLETTKVKPDKDTRKERKPPHKPKDIATFMGYFKKGNGLKFLTHDYTRGSFIPEEIRTEAKKEFDELTNKNLSITQNLWRKINGFGFSKHGWSRLKIEDNKLMTQDMSGWQTKDMQDWFRKNKGVHPASDNVPIKIKDIIVAFKNNIEIRKNLKEIIYRNLKLKLAEEFDEWQITTDNLERAKFYTNIDALEVGLRSLFVSMKQHAKSKVIHLDFSRDRVDNYRTRTIHINNVNSWIENEPFIENILGGDLDTTKGIFTGLCNWHLEAEFRYKNLIEYWRLPILTDNEQDKPIKIPKPNKIGVNHLITFYA